MVSTFGQNPHGHPARAPAGPLRRRTGLGGRETAAAAAATATDGDCGGGSGLSGDGGGLDGGRRRLCVCVRSPPPHWDGFA